MAGSAGAVARAAGRGAPVPDGARQPRDKAAPRSPRLSVVDQRRALTRARRRQALVLRTLGVALVVGALAAAAIAHGVVASQQQRLNALQTEVGQSLIAQQDLQLARAQLEAPPRILQIATGRLGMVTPQTVTYLPPVDPGPSVQAAQQAAQRRALAAQRRAVATRSASPRTTTPSTR